jgi:hypothetical protein
MLEYTLELLRGSGANLETASGEKDDSACSSHAYGVVYMYLKR